MHKTGLKFSIQQVNEICTLFLQVRVHLCVTEGKCVSQLPLSFLKKETLQEMHRTASPVLAFTQSTFTQV